jgi:BASS family bile acid:Na+ symporter
MMLLLSFCKISHKELKITPLHLYLLLFQLVCAFGSYMLLKTWNPVVAQGALICFLAPTATSAVVITMKLGGSGTSIMSYTILVNLFIAVAMPFIFPLVHPNPDLSFWEAFILTLEKVFPMLIAPFFLAWILKARTPKIHAYLGKIHGLAFYLWAIALAIATGLTFGELLASKSDISTLLMLAVVSLFACIAQFIFGKMLGAKYGDLISGGQAAGQKNTVLAIWLAHSYLNPLSAIAPGAYVLWQNSFNSWQLWRKRRAESKE